VQEQVPAKEQKEEQQQEQDELWQQVPQQVPQKLAVPRAGRAITGLSEILDAQ
jgi:hypothetical protein